VLKGRLRKNRDVQEKKTTRVPEKRILLEHDFCLAHTVEIEAP